MYFTKLMDWVVAAVFTLLSVAMALVWVFITFSIVIALINLVRPIT